MAHWQAHPDRRLLCRWIDQVGKPMLVNLRSFRSFCVIGLLVARCSSVVIGRSWAVQGDAIPVETVDAADDAADAADS